MIPQISDSDFDRDKRITILERQVALLSAQLISRDAAVTQLFREIISIQADTALSFLEQYPQMLSEIDLKVQEAMTAADQEAPEEVSR